MINLLPPEHKEQILAGRSNILLLNYIISSGVLLLLVAGLVGAIYFLLVESKADAEAEISNNLQKSSQYAQVERDAQEFQANLAIAKEILGQETRYSKVLISIAQTIPSGITLESITLQSETLASPMKLVAKGYSQDDAIRLKTSLESSKIFSNVYLDSVARGDSTENSKPFTITINTTMIPEEIK